VCRSRGNVAVLGACFAVRDVENGVALQDWGDLGNLGRDMTMSSVGEMLAARYGLAVLVLRAMHTGEVAGELYTHGTAGDCLRAEL
jgi:hypothetical protein